MDVLLCLELCSIHAGKQIPLFVVLYSASLMSYPLDVDLSMHDRLEVTSCWLKVQTIELVGLGQNIVFSTYKLSTSGDYCEE